jgi:UDP-glucose 4-epimerase
MRVVIVGGAGFIGTALAQSLRRHGLHPLVLDTAPRLTRASSALEGVDTAAFDFTVDRSAASLLGGADALVHLACTTNPSHSMRDMVGDAESNIAPSIHLFDAAVAAGVRRVVFASSGGTVYGAPARLPVVETDPTRPLCAYGVSKLAIERYLALYPQLGGISLRVANPYGTHQLGGATVGVIARFVAAVRDNAPIEVWGDGSIVRDYIAIEDVVDAFRSSVLSESLAPGQYNIGSGSGASVSKVIEVIFRAANRTVPVTYRQGRSYDVPAIVLNPSAFQAATGWQARISLQNGVCDFWLKALEKPDPARPLPGSSSSKIQN